MKGSIFSVLCLASQLCFCAETVVFKSDFAQNRDLKGWWDVWNHGKKVNSTYYKVVEENGEVFYRVVKVNGKQMGFGLSHKLDKPVAIKNDVQQVILEVTLRKHQGNISYMAGAALSSRTSLEGNQGQAFARGKDSGFLMMGNDYTKHISGNYISWQKDGNAVTLHPSKTPCNFMLGLEKWLNWKLVYDHQAKELRFYRDSKDAKPFLVQRKVNLDGVVLQSVWLAGYSHEYKNVKVSVIKK